MMCTCVEVHAQINIKENGGGAGNRTRVLRK